MYQHPENKSDNSKMATKKRFIKYKVISGKLEEHYNNFELLADRNIKNADKVYCIHCDKSFAYHGFNTSLTYHLQKNTRYNIQNFSLQSQFYLASLQRQCHLLLSKLL